MNKGVSVRKKNPLYMCAVRYGREKRGGVSTEYYGSGKRNGRSRVLSDDGRCFGYTAPFFSYTEKTHASSSPPQKKSFISHVSPPPESNWGAFASIPFFLIRVIARRHSSLHRHNNRKDWIRGKKRLRGKRFSHESLYECSFPRLQCPTEKGKKPFSSRLGDVLVQPWGRMRNSKKECLRSTDSFIESDHFGK